VLTMASIYLKPPTTTQLHPALDLVTGPMAAPIRLHYRITRLSTPVFRPATRVQVKQSNKNRHHRVLYVIYRAQPHHHRHPYPCRCRGPPPSCAPWRSSCIRAGSSSPRRCSRRSIRYIRDIQGQEPIDDGPITALDSSSDRPDPMHHRHRQRHGRRRPRRRSAPSSTACGPTLTTPCASPRPRPPGR